MSNATTLAGQSDAANTRSLKGVVRWLRRVACCHTFRLGGQSLTGIPEPEKPEDNAGYAAWSEYYQSLYNGPSFTKRVQWPCAKCGKVFFAHCGLDILSHGNIQPPNNELSGGTSAPTTG